MTLDARVAHRGDDRREQAGAPKAAPYFFREHFAAGSTFDVCVAVHRVRVSPAVVMIAVYGRCAEGGITAMRSYGRTPRIYA